MSIYFRKKITEVKFIYTNNSIRIDIIIIMQSDYRYVLVCYFTLNIWDILLMLSIIHDIMS